MCGSCGVEVESYARLLLRLARDDGNLTTQMHAVRMARREREAVSIVTLRIFVPTFLIFISQNL